MNTPEKRKVLLTGLLETSQKTAHIVKEYAAEALVFPLQRTKKIPCNFKPFYDWAIFTSPAAVRHFYEAAENTMFAKAAVIGPSTRAALEKAGRSADLIPEEYNAAALVKALNKEIDSNNSVLYPCSALADFTLEDGLMNHCLFYREELYAPEKVEKQNLPEFTDAVFFSASAVRVMFEYYGKDCLDGKNVAVIGGKTASAVKSLFKIDAVIADKSTAEGTVRTLLGYSP